jgi:hypothetical protein
MSHFAGVAVPRLADARLLYYHTDELKAHVTLADWHMIISPLMLAEWRDLLGMRLVHGLRTDLKENTQCRNALEAVEATFRTAVFEGTVTALMEGCSLKTIRGWKEIDTPTGRHTLPCGEIDILGYSEQANTLFVVECKAIAPAVDTRMLASGVSDYFEQKKYHAQLLRKTSWIAENIATVASEFQTRCRVTFGRGPVVRSLFVTLHPHPAKFLQTDHEVLRIDEFEDMLETL